MSLVEGSERFFQNPAWLYIDINYEFNKKKRLKCFDLTKTLCLQGLTFRLIVAQIILNEGKSNCHFKGIFLINDSFILIYDIDHENRSIELPKKRYKLPVFS